MMENRYCVIMCGGVGSRFWPFSKSSAPKQFIDFFGTGRSLLQMSFDRVAEIVPVRNILAITNERYAPLVAALYDGSDAADISTEVTFEDGRKGVISARVKVRDAKLYPVAGQEAPSSAKAA